ncbi:polysaccharide deacetylase family protein [Bacillus sp. FJAT-51639]|uniref:Polysaccharide deacetylase family protein n=1 Tax=Bacillus bruguierae TaxID=3127667 RepID=A0ABU8FJ65_9BACI
MKIRIILFIVILWFAPMHISYISYAKDRLYEEIEERAKVYAIPPQNACIDRVWKATPGYNGKEVDVRASYGNMKRYGSFDEKQLVYREVSPKVHLTDLPPTPIYRGNPSKKMVALTINVAWGNEYLSRMLEILQKHNVKATFFLEGRWVKENLRFAKMIADADQEVGNHSYTHPDMRTLSVHAIHEQLQKTNQVIEAATNQKVRWFAPPSGSFRDDVVHTAAKMHMGTIMWTVDTIDWKHPEPHVLLQRVLSKVHPGAIILMHPTSSSAESLDTLISKLKEKGYTVGNVSALVDEKRID